MHEMTASEASRNFSALLDSVEQGETVLITRSGRRVAQIAPTPTANGRALKHALGRFKGTVDERLEANIAAARQAAAVELDSDPWQG
jgi:prevent-host-death family protein